MMVRRRISAVSYLNTIPFIYGIKHAGVDLCADLVLSPPSGTVTVLENHQADIALVPVAAIPAFKDVNIFSDLCIGAAGPVRTVVLVGNSPVEQLRTIYLDSHSTTSALLVRILASELWNVGPEWKELTDYTVLNRARPDEGFLLIGDKVFDNEGKFEYTYDLAEGWGKLTGLPFVFAAWVARGDVDREYLLQLNQALHYGVSHIKEAIAESKYSGRDYTYSYLTKNIDFIFDGQKRRAMELFWDKGMKAAPLVNPG